MGEKLLGVGADMRAVESDACKGEGWGRVVQKPEPRGRGGSEMWTACERAESCMSKPCTLYVAHS